MKTIGYAVVGTGYFGAELARIMKEQEGARVVAVYDPENAGTVAAELGCDTETDLDRLYSREDVDAVIVASPNYLHKEPVIKAAEHGVHVFCEKPIALSYQDCVEMVEACVAHNVTFMAGHVMNFFKGVRTAKKMINDGVIGKVLYCHSARNGWGGTVGQSRRYPSDHRYPATQCGCHHRIDQGQYAQSCGILRIQRCGFTNDPGYERCGEIAW